MSEVEPEISNTIEADEPVNELPPVEEEAPKTEPIIEPTQEIKPVEREAFALLREPLKNNSETQARNEKKINLSKMSKDSHSKVIPSQSRTQLPRTIRI